MLPNQSLIPIHREINWQPGKRGAAVTYCLICDGGDNVFVPQMPALTFFSKAHGQTLSSSTSRFFTPALRVSTLSHVLATRRICMR